MCEIDQGFKLSKFRLGLSRQGQAQEIGQDLYLQAFTYQKVQSYSADFRVSGTDVVDEGMKESIEGW